MSCLKVLWCLGGGQPTEDPDLVQDQRNEEHDWGQENPTYLQDERQTKRGKPTIVYQQQILQLQLVQEVCLDLLGNIMKMVQI